MASMSGSPSEATLGASDGVLELFKNSLLFAAWEAPDAFDSDVELRGRAGFTTTAWWRRWGLAHELGGADVKEAR